MSPPPTPEKSLCFLMLMRLGCILTINLHVNPPNCGEIVVFSHVKCAWPSAVNINPANPGKSLCPIMVGGRVTTNFGGVDVVPLLVPLQGAIVVCHDGGRGKNGKVGVLGGEDVGGCFVLGICLLLTC